MLSSRSQIFPTEFSYHAFDIGSLRVIDVFHLSSAHALCTIIRIQSTLHRVVFRLEVVIVIFVVIIF